MSGLAAAIHLARGETGAVGRLSAEPADVANSFVAIAVAVVPLIATRLMLWSAGPGIPANAIHLLLLDVMVFTVSWLAFAIVSHRLAVRLGRLALWPRFLITYNWCNVVANLMVLAGAVPEALGAPALVAQLAQLVVTGWALWLGWFAIGLTLRTGPLLAFYFVIVEQLIGIGFVVAGVALTSK